MSAIRSKSYPGKRDLSGQSASEEGGLLAGKDASDLELLRVRSFPLRKSPLQSNDLV